MDALRQWAFSICCTMVACGMAQILLPKSNMEKMFKLCVSIFFLCCLLSPIVIRSPDLRIQVQELTQEDILARAERLTALLDTQSNQAVSENVEKIVADNLREMGINYHSITIHITTNGQHGDTLVVDITLDREYEPRHDEIRNALQAELGLDVRLGYA